MVDTVSTVLEEKHVCSAVFQDLEHAFDRDWHTGLKFKLKQILPPDLYLLLVSYLTNRTFTVKINELTSEEKKISTSVPQGSLLEPILYLICTADMPVSNQTILATFADDIATMASNENAEFANLAIQQHIDKVQTWANNWRIKFNNKKCQHITFTNRPVTFCTKLVINNSEIPQVTSVKYLGIYMDRRLNWRFHIEQTSKRVSVRANLLSSLLGRRSNLSLDLKRRIYLTVIASIWKYGIELYGNSKASNLVLIQRQQSKILRTMVSTPKYVSNHTLHKDLNIPFIQDVHVQQYRRFFDKLRLSGNLNILRMSRNTLTGNLRRRLKEDGAETLFLPTMVPYMHHP